MYTTYHLTSAEEITSDIVDSIKATFKSRPIKIIVEEDFDEMSLSQENISILESRLAENEAEYIAADKSLKILKEKYGL